jgi:4-carboxymuconolactone decarboxylase
MSEIRKAPRFPRLTIGEMNDEQTEVAERILGGRRMEGRPKAEPTQVLGGPFNAWMQSPKLADALQVVGEFLRFNTSLPTKLSELAILLSARHWTAQYEWYAHARMALAGGLDPRIVDAIAAGRRPEDMPAEEEATYDFCTELRRDKNVGDESFARAVDLFGHAGAIEILAISGYYDLVSMTLNVAQVRVPKGERDPLQPL